MVPHFLLTEYDDHYRMEHFHVSRKCVQCLSKLMPWIEKTNTKFWSTMFVSIHMACNLYKLVHVAQYFHCSKFFAIKKSTMRFVLHEFTCAMNTMLNNQFKWLERNEMVEIMAKFKDFCDLPSIHGAIIAT